MTALCQGRGCFRAVVLVLRSCLRSLPRPGLCYGDALCTDAERQSLSVARQEEAEGREKRGRNECTGGRDLPEGLEGSGVFLLLPWPWVGAFTCWGFGVGAGTRSLGPAALGGGRLWAVGQGPAREAPLKEQPRAGEMNNVIIGKLNLSCSFLFLS